MDDSFLGMLPMFFFVIIIYGLLGVVGLASYVLRGIGILRMSESRGLQNGWLGFIPFAAEYQLGKIAGEVEFGKKTIKKPGVWLVLFPLITYGVFFVIYFVLLFGMIGMADFGGYGWDEPSPGAISAMIIGIVVCYLFLYAGAIMICLLQGLVFHRIFSCYSDGQKPIFHMLICLFVPLGSAILLSSYGKKPMQHLPPYMTVYTQGYPNYQQYQQQYQQYQQYYYGNAQPQPPQYGQTAPPPVQQGIPPQPMTGPEQNVGPIQPPQYGQPVQSPVQQEIPPQLGVRPEQTSEPENGGNTDQKQD